jgi:hypothetical protein
MKLFAKQYGLLFPYLVNDAHMGNASTRESELINAMRMIAETGKGPNAQYPSMGCSIKWRGNT